MHKFVISFVCFIFSVSVIAETVYKKTNPDGSVSFTDVPSENSKEIKIRKPTTFSPPPPPKFTLPTKKLKPNYNYVVEIKQPVHDSTIVNKPDVTVSITIQPRLSNYGHKIRYQLDELSAVSPSTSKVFKNVSRGTHKLQITVVDQNGNAVSPVTSSTFHMKRFFKKPVLPVKPKPISSP